MTPNTLFSSRKTRFAFAAVSGLLLSTSYIPFPAWAIFFGLIPLWLALRSTNSIIESFILGWVTEIVFHLIACSWIPSAMHGYFGLEISTSYLALGIFAAFMNWPIAVASGLYKMTRARGPLSFLILPVLFAAVESIVPRIFPWTLGDPWLWMNWQGYQFADVIGFSGLSFLSYVLNSVFMTILISSMKRSMKAICTLVAGILILILNAAGASYSEIGEKHEKSVQIQVLLVQGNIDNQVKVDSELGQLEAKKITSDRYFIKTVETLKDMHAQNKTVDFVLWPETAHPGAISRANKGDYFSQRVLNLVDTLNSPIVTGGYTSAGPFHSIANAVYSLEPREEPLVYTKRRLTPFGEYVPGAALFPSLENKIPTLARFTSGNSLTLLRVGSLAIGPMICYESLFPNHARELVQNGADLFVNVTNDKWFGHIEADQNLNMSLERAIEFRRPLIRAANSGWSAFISSDGLIKQISEFDRFTADLYTIDIEKRGLTFFARYGQWYPLILVLLIFLIEFGDRLRKIPPTKENPSIYKRPRRPR